jgi:hypothetical protein
VTASRAGTVSATQGASTVSSGTLVFAAADVGRQFRVGTNATYTILAVAIGVATLDRVYTESTDAATLGTVLDAYVTVPADFARFYAVIDPSTRWRVRTDVPLEWLNRIDAVRQGGGGTPRMLVNATYSPVPATFGRPRYEWYPSPATAQQYPYYYVKRAALLADDSLLVGPLTDAKDILVEGALSRAALWPGLEGRKNVYFNLQLAKIHEQKFLEKISQSYVADEEIYWEGMPIAEIPYSPWWPGPGDAAWLQSHVEETIG